MIDGSELGEHPFHPIAPASIRRAQELGDELPVAWRHRTERYAEKLATPDTSVADLIGDVDPIKVAEGRSLGDPETIHYGLIPRSHRGIVAINELPDLAERIQVSLLNVMEERDIQIRGYTLRLNLDVLVVATANPEDYTNRGRIITPLQDRFGAEIRTHYPQTIEEEIAVIRQEADLVAEVPPHLLEVLARFTRNLRESEAVDQRAGVSARFAIAGAETIAAAALHRATRQHEEVGVARPVDLETAVDVLGGKIEFETGEEGRERAILEHLLRTAVADTARAHLRGVDARVLVDALHDGATVMTGEQVTAADVLAAMPVLGESDLYDEVAGRLGAQTAGRARRCARAAARAALSRASHQQGQRRRERPSMAERWFRAFRLASLAQRPGDRSLSEERSDETKRAEPSENDALMVRGFHRTPAHTNRYGPYSGGPDPLAPPVEVQEALEAIGRDVMSGTSAERAMREYLRRGSRDREGLDDLARRVRERRAELMRRHRLDGTLEEVRKLLDHAVLEERKRLATDVEHRRRRPAFAEMRLENLPASTAAAVNELADYDWQSPAARADYERINELLGRELLDQRFAGMKNALEGATDADRQAIRDMLADLNDLLEKRRLGEDTPEDFDEFMRKHGGQFPENPQNLDELLDALAERSAAAQRMLNSMTPEQRDELMNLAAQAFGSPDLMQSLSRLDDNLRSLRPDEDWTGSASFSGDRADRSRRGDGDHAGSRRPRLPLRPAEPVVSRCADGRHRCRRTRASRRR